ncbi:hypothetical protein G5V59_15865 [Nocardioides sp. W3-2-3]|uniref:hypothetical protein n=1 Tax=Nocardioides convexus TaxID=2712224 RepID=UPI0024182287|nr:hypothetical protein [Nocardioides convexus]NHA00899.1 hypothetical protein [Nocardioides convexus]
MTWNETHERIRIIREVEAAAAADLTGALPWREEWNAFFNGPAGLVAALRSRWHHMCEAQARRARPRGTVRRQLTAGCAVPRRRSWRSSSVRTSPPWSLLTLTGPRPLPSSTRSRRFHRGPVLPV